MKKQTLWSTEKCKDEVEKYRQQLSAATAANRGPGDSIQGRQVVNSREELCAQTDTRGLHSREGACLLTVEETRSWYLTNFMHKTFEGSYINKLY